MVRIGKWAPKVIMSGYKVWAGTYSKTVSAATNESVTMNGATGIVDVKAAISGKGGTVDVCATTGPASVVLGASLDATIGDAVILWVAGE